MPEYDIKFSIKLSEVALALVGQGIDSPEARRTVIYIGRLSMEIALKALLELSGKQISAIKKHWHNLQKILEDVESHQFEIDGQWHSGAEIQTLGVQFGVHAINLGDIIEAEKHGASTFPQGIRYGDNANVRDVAPEIIAPASSVLLAWVEKCTKGRKP